MLFISVLKTVGLLDLTCIQKVISGALSGTLWTVDSSLLLVNPSVLSGFPYEFSSYSTLLYPTGGNVALSILGINTNLISS